MANIENLVTRLENLTGEPFDCGSLIWLCNDRLSPGALQTLGLSTILPGKQNPLHYHPNCEELLYVLSGCGRHRIGEEFVEVRPGTTVRIPAGVIHNLVNTGSETLTCLISFSSGDRQTVFLD
jgi:mannose-6-phosphate isomerase-like protein (cupin superfamily)